MAERTTERDARGAAEVVSSVLRELASVAESGATDAGGRLFFPNGIDSLEIGVKVAGVEVTLKAAGPRAAAAELAVESAPAFMLSESVTTTGFVQLPQGTSDYLHYSAPERQFGTQKTIDAVVDVA